MIQADMHMHTWFSTDSEACPRDMADEAVRKGLKTICFTDHFDKDDLEWGEDEILCTFEEPQRAITPGQAVVLYDGEYVLGGGTIIADK